MGPAKRQALTACYLLKSIIYSDYPNPDAMLSDDHFWHFSVFQMCCNLSLMQYNELSFCIYHVRLMVTIFLCAFIIYIYVYFILFFLFFFILLFYTPPFPLPRRRSFASYQAIVLIRILS